MRTAAFTGIIVCALGASLVGYAQDAGAAPPLLLEEAVVRNRITLPEGTTTSQEIDGGLLESARSPAAAPSSPATPQSPASKPSSTAPSPPSASPSTAEAGDPSEDKLPVAPDSKQIEKLREIYDVASKAMGAEHVLLTATAYMGKPCFGGGCGRLQGGVAGLVSVPLLGVGGGHNWDLYPVLQTQDSTKAFAAFQGKLQDYVTLLDNANYVVADPAGALRALQEAAKSLLEQADLYDPDAWRLARRAKKCLVAVSSLRASGRAQVAASIAQPSEDGMRAAYDAAGSAAGQRTEDKYRMLTKVKDIGKVSERELIDACESLLTAVSDAKSVAEQLRYLAKLLAEYWAKTPKDELVTRRHHALLGPTLGIPVTQDPTKVVLVGGLLELGAKSYFRIGISGGIQVRYDQIFAEPGWFGGLAVSGEFGDDLFHLLNGGLSAARAVSSKQQ